MIGVRAAIWLTGFLGTLYAIIALFSTLPEVGAGMAVAAVSIIAWGLMDWIEER